MKISLLILLLLTIDNYLDHFLQHYSKRLEKAKSYIPFIIEKSKEYNVDPLLVAIIISCESSWRPNVIGPVGERGLMQVHGIAANGYNMSQPKQQIEAGISWLGKCYVRCKGDILQAINAYGTGKCKPIKPFAKRRYRLYQRWKNGRTNNY